MARGTIQGEYEPRSSLAKVYAKMVAFTTRVAILLFATFFRSRHNALAIAGPPHRLRGDLQAVADLIDRVLPSPASSIFDLQIVDNQDCAPGISPPCFSLADKDQALVVKGTTASELTAGLGHYFRHFCNMTIGWPRGGGSNVFVPETWPSIGSTLFAKHRNTPYSYLMNVW